MASEKNKAKKKKGITRHHIRYGANEIVVELPNKGIHLCLTGFQAMSPTKQNIKWLLNVRRALDYIIKEKKQKLYGG